MNEFCVSYTDELATKLSVFKRDIKSEMGTTDESKVATWSAAILKLTYDKEFNKSDNFNIIYFMELARFIDTMDVDKNEDFMYGALCKLFLPVFNKTIKTMNKKANAKSETVEVKADTGDKEVDQTTKPSKKQKKTKD